MVAHPPLPAGAAAAVAAASSKSESLSANATDTPSAKVATMIIFTFPIRSFGCRLRGWGSRPIRQIGLPVAFESDARGRPGRSALIRRGKRAQHRGDRGALRRSERVDERLK